MKLACDTTRGRRSLHSENARVPKSREAVHHFIFEAHYSIRQIPYAAASFSSCCGTELWVGYLSACYFLELHQPKSDSRRDAVAKSGPVHKNRAAGLAIASVFHRNM